MNSRIKISVTFFFLGFVCGCSSPMEELRVAIVQRDTNRVAAALDKHHELVNQKNPESGQTALHLAAWVGHKGVIDILLAREADVNAKDFQGQTPLHVAVDVGRVEVVELLLTSKADVNAKDMEGATPLKSARIFQEIRAQSLKPQYKKIAEILIKHGAKE